MNSLLLNTDIAIFLLGEFILWVVLLIAFGVNLYLLKKWDFHSYTNLQYRIEKLAYLIMVIIIFSFLMKFILLPYFVFTMDKISDIVPGAMCSAGVISFNAYGMKLFFIKMAILLLLMIWLMINHYDIEAKVYPWFRAKSWLFVFIFILITIELYWDYAFFADIDIHKVLNCCSTLYGLLEGVNPLPFGLDKREIIILFYMIYAMIISSTFGKQNYILLIGLILFIPIGYYSVLYFFGTYIYEMPNHNCPFCMLQKDYYYIGYPLWGSFFGGVFLGITAILAEERLKKDSKRLKYLMVLSFTIFVTICTFFVLHYYYKNGVFLEPVKVEMVM
ncbi:MAG: hypothetical protein GXO60_09190 [Epsilonproteobacteria bacterium]|nr:hypothetical protein [Campylobacterota bacterium]